MKENQFNFLFVFITLLILSCSKEDYDLQKMNPSTVNLVLSQPNQKAMKGATQISGVGEGIFVSDPTSCDFTSWGADYAIQLSGDLVGCLFTFVKSYNCSPSGTYLEQGEEYFVGSYNGEEGTFWTTYRFEAKYEDCSTLIGEIFGRCQHPIQVGSGTGVFEGVSGRLDFKDNVETGALPYRGHLRY